MNRWEEDRKIRRDLEAARQFRRGPRREVHINDLARQWLHGPEARRIKKFQQINGIIQELFDAKTCERIQAKSFVKGILTLIIADSVLLAEMKNHHHHRLHDALIHAGTGVSKIVYRLKR